MKKIKKIIGFNYGSPEDPPDQILYYNFLDECEALNLTPVRSYYRDPKPWWNDLSGDRARTLDMFWATEEQIAQIKSVFPQILIYTVEEMLAVGEAVVEEE